MTARIVECETTEEDYIEATCFSTRHCVLARCIQRATGDPEWELEGDAFTHRTQDKWAIVPDWIKNLEDWFDGISFQCSEEASSLPIPLLRFKFNTTNGEVSDPVCFGSINPLEIWIRRVHQGTHTRIASDLAVRDDLKRCDDEIDVATSVRTAALLLENRAAEFARNDPSIVAMMKDNELFNSLMLLKIP